MKRRNFDSDNGEVKTATVRLKSRIIALKQRSENIYVRLKEVYIEKIIITFEFSLKI